MTAESGRGSRGQSPFARSKRKLEEYPFCVLAITKDNSTPKAPRVIYKNQRSRYGNLLKLAINQNAKIDSDLLEKSIKAIESSKTAFNEILLKMEYRVI
uniref:hypothetical protein n=1 Tax=Pasteurella multocida TaxID=747 RepID=UPI0015E857FB|nr:hypothetical protein [Pasteurella multocida]